MVKLSRLLEGLGLCLVAANASAWDSHRLVAPVTVNGHTVPYAVFSIFVAPGSDISVGIDGRPAATGISLGGTPVGNAAGQIQAADKAGLEVLEIRHPDTGEICRINVFTLVSAKQIDGEGRLNGYRIGAYPREPLRGLEIYLAPPGFVEVTESNIDTHLSPNFTLREFVTKQEADFPKYLILRPELLLKLEAILAALNNSGHPTSAFVVMSGYRTPYYNHAIGNVPYSRHVYGGAADIYIDENPRDGVMDDLNRDGRFDNKDANWLAGFIDAMSQRGEFGPRIGGLGIYGRTATHGPFVHVDVRGTRARW